MARRQIFGLRALLVALAMTVACGGSGSSSTESAGGDEPAVVWRDLRVDGAARRYRLYTPPVLDDARAIALVVALHGSENSVDSFVEATELDDAADAHSFVVAYPEGTSLLWNGGFCCTSGRGSAAGDVRFLEQVIADVSGSRRIDPARVYAVGVSGGGVMAYRLACDRPELVAGVVSVSGAMSDDPCDSSRPVSVMEIHGTADGIVPYGGGRVQGGATAPALPAPAVVAGWAARNGCAGEPLRQVDGLVTTETWSGCANSTTTRLVTVEGGSHNWYSTVYGLPNGAIDATAAVVDFLRLARR